MSFSEQLEVGRIGEGEIARWLQSKGYNVLPAYEVSVDHGKGPRVFGARRSWVSPDLLAFNHSRAIWVEAKTKAAFTYHRLSGTFQTGIDRRHWKDYLEVRKLSDWPVWLLFLQRPGNLAKDTPIGMTSPCGLYGQEILKLESTIHHEHVNWGPSGMVYWTVEALKKLR